MRTVAKTAAVPRTACVATPGYMVSKTREMPPTKGPSNAADATMSGTDGSFLKELTRPRTRPPMPPSIARGRASGPESHATAPRTTTIASRLTVLTVVSSKVIRSVSSGVADGRL